jgi:class 3 adenylate cyclase
MGKETVSPTIAIISLTACVISFGLLVALRQPQAWERLTTLQTCAPLFDGMILAVFITNIWHVLSGSYPEIITNVAAFCCLLAVSGGIRIRRRASVLTTALALGNFAYAAVLFGLNPAVSLFALFTILGTGLLGMLTAGIVRRQGNNEAGRLLMQQFLPENVVEAAFESPLSLLEEAQECDVTVMVTDLRGFTHYSENLKPMEVLAFLNQLQGFLSEVVEQQGGWVDKFMGDGMLAVFGTPRVLEDHAERAFAAARIILEEVRTRSPLPIGISLHSGTVVSGCLGAEGRLEFTIIGDTVNVASRLEALTKEFNCSLLVSHTTARKLPARSLRSLGEVPLRGRDQTVEIFTASWASGLPENLQISEGT